MYAQPLFTFDARLPPTVRVTERDLELRDYQVRLVDDAFQSAMVEGAPTILYAPTGAGKTECGISLAKRILANGGRVLWTVNRIELIEQTSRRFFKAGVNHGIIQSNHILTNKTLPLQVASIQTISRRKATSKFDLIIIDEAHGATSQTYRNLRATHKNTPVIGLTATPFSKGLGGKCKEIGDAKLFERLVKHVTVADLVDQGWLVDCKIFAPSKPDLSHISIRMGDYDEQQLAALVNTNKLVGDIVETWLKRANKVRTICFATSIEHSQNIVGQFCMKGIPAEHIDAYTPTEERNAILNRLRTGETLVVSNVALLAEGFDLPDLGCMILARPTKSLTRYLQMIGRVMRPAHGKAMALVLDHSGTVEQLGFPTDDLPLELDDGKKRILKQVKKESLPKICPRCAFLRPPGTRGCTACGWEPTAFRNNPEKYDGDLVEIKRPEIGRDERQQIYSSFIGFAQQKGYAPGWAAHQFKEMFKVWPDGLKREPGVMVERAKNHILSGVIARKKAKANTRNIKCMKCGNDKVILGISNGTKHRQAICSTCKSTWWITT